MTARDLRTEIDNILVNLTEDNLKSLLSYLKEVQKVDSTKILTSSNLSKILEEDTELLKRLAQ